MAPLDAARAAKDAAARARLLAEALDHLAHCLNGLELEKPPPSLPIAAKTGLGSAEGLWDVDDVAAFLKTSRSWVYHAAQSGRLPSLRVSRTLRFDPSAVKAFALGDQPR